MIPVLKNIMDKVSLRIEEDKKNFILKENSRKPRDFRKAFDKEFSLITEVKLASPSEGDIYPNARPIEIAKEYLENGAAALSVLTERDIFKGDPFYLAEIRNEFPDAYLLMKDFIVDEFQLKMARSIGADTVLLIVALLGKERTKEMIELAQNYGFCPLVEVHNQEELEIALSAKAQFIGVNNRNLKTMEVSLENSKTLAKKVPKNITLISESGIKTHNDLKELKEYGFHGFLVGTSLMKTKQPGITLKGLLKQ